MLIERISSQTGYIATLFLYSFRCIDFFLIVALKWLNIIIGDWNVKVGSQKTPGVTGKFVLGVQKGAGQRLTEFCQENELVIANTLFQQDKGRLYTWTSSDG